MFCPTCGSDHIVKNGHIPNSWQKYACKNCGRQFVENPENVGIDRTKKLYWPVIVGKDSFILMVRWFQKLFFEFD